jgi:hypothetical protein
VPVKIAWKSPDSCRREPDLCDPDLESGRIAGQSEEDVKSEESRDYRPDTARKTRSVPFRSLDPETVKKIVKILLWVGMSVFYLADSLKSGGAKPWTRNPVRKGVVVLVVLVLLWVVTKILRDSVVSPRQAKEEHNPGSNSPIDPA